MKVLTGDNELVTAKICREVGLEAGVPLLGGMVDGLDDAGLVAAASRATVMARLTPLQKERIVAALRRAGHVVGFMGDGINDAPALRAANVGISVDAAVDIARASVDCVLLPFVPMTPLQILTTNLLYDCSQVPIPTDAVDPELVARPRPWSMRQISRFILLVGPISSIFDYTTWGVLLVLFGCADPARAAIFQTGWFVESLLTQTLIIHVIRTDRIPFLQSRASVALTATTLVVAAAGVWLVESPLAGVFGFVPLPAGYWPILGVTIVAYAAVTYAVKRWLVRRRLID
ncbi:MAG: HAD-IC family P-type ATPase [Planctomycetaceae bacterium]